MTSAFCAGDEPAEISYRGKLDLFNGCFHFGGVLVAINPHKMGFSTAPSSPETLNVTDVTLHCHAGIDQLEQTTNRKRK